MKRRRFLQRTGVAIGAGLALPALSDFDTLPLEPLSNNWVDVRGQFQLDKGKVHMAQMLLASHPKPVVMPLNITGKCLTQTRWNTRKNTL